MVEVVTDEMLFAGCIFTKADDDVFNAISEGAYGDWGMGIDDTGCSNNNVRRYVTGPRLARWFDDDDNDDEEFAACRIHVASLSQLRCDASQAPSKPLIG